MDDSFKVRVDKVFGALASSTSTTPPESSNLSSLWSLTDNEIERKEWTGDKSEPETDLEPDSFLFKQGFLPSSRDELDSGFQLGMEKDLDELDDDDDDDDDDDAESSKLGNKKPDDYNDEEWEIKNSIGLDCTLDYEEEEDQYDKVAVGKEKPGDRLYMKDVNDYGINVDSNNELPVSLKDAARDPRANHMAAKLRLKEDAEAAEKMDSLRVSDQDLPGVGNDRVKVNDDRNLKSILKKRDDKPDSKSKDNQLESKSQKRVRFDPECIDESDKGNDEVSYVQMEDDTEDKSLVYPLPPDYPSGIPDYMRNPSKYTRYTFDSSSDINDQSNKNAFMDFLKMLKKSNGSDSEADDALTELPKSVTFVPRKKLGDTEMVDSHTESKQNQDNSIKDVSPRKAAPMSIAAGDEEGTEPSAMDEDEQETAADKKSSSRRAGRKYRSKSNLETEESM